MVRAAHQTADRRAPKLAPVLVRLSYSRDIFRNDYGIYLEGVVRFKANLVGTVRSH